MGLPEADWWKQPGQLALAALTGGIQGFNVYLVQETTSKLANIIGLCSRELDAAEAPKVEHEDGHRVKTLGKQQFFTRNLLFSGVSTSQNIAGAHLKWTGLVKHQKTSEYASLPQVDNVRVVYFVACFMKTITDKAGSHNKNAGSESSLRGTARPAHSNEPQSEVMPKKGKAGANAGQWTRTKPG